MNPEDELNERVDALIDYLKNTGEYREYKHASRILDESPDVKAKVYEFRKDNYFLQHAPKGEDIYEKVENLRKKNEDILYRPEVSDFLMTEWAFFSMVQNVFSRIMDNMEF
ncbi:MAG: YlbF family regulator [Lachnospiraceae bacterium]|nr:YlbF family regulator [Lachnospiraceae bacterium]